MSRSNVQPPEFEEFIRDVAPDLLNYFTRRVTPTESAADCLAEVLLALWRRNAALPAGPDERRAWAFGIARGVLRNHFRSQNRAAALTQRLRRELADIDQTRSNAQGIVRDALAELKPDDRELVLLVAWEGFTVTGAAHVLGIKPDAARARYSRARARLRNLLTQKSAQP